MALCILTVFIKRTSKKSLTWANLLPIFSRKFQVIQRSVIRKTGQNIALCKNYTYKAVYYFKVKGFLIKSHVRYKATHIERLSLQQTQYAEMEVGAECSHLAQACAHVVHCPNTNTKYSKYIHNTKT